MTTIYVDPSALLLTAGDADVPDEHVAPGASEAVAHLVDGGYEILLLGTDDGLVPELPAGVRRVAALPDHLEADAWYVTGESNPTFGRPRGGTTVLVGPRRPVGKVPLPRFDLETRDMASATMEILTRDAMA